MLTIVTLYLGLGAPDLMEPRELCDKTKVCGLWCVVLLAARKRRGMGKVRNGHAPKMRNTRCRKALIEFEEHADPLTQQRKQTRDAVKQGLDDT